jgi:Mrp family chromosome partitioning ATPase
VFCDPRARPTTELRQARADYVWVSLGVSGEAEPAVDPGWKRGPGLGSALWRYRWAVLAFAVLSAAVGYIYTATQPPVYEAAGKVMLVNPNDRTMFRNERGVAYVEADRYLSTQAHRMTSPDVLAAAAELLEGRFHPGQIRQVVKAQSSTSIFELTVQTRLDDPTDAADVVNAVIQAYQNVASAQLQAQVEASVAQLAELQTEARTRLDQLSDEDDSDPVVQAERELLSAELTDLQMKAGQIRADAAVYGAGIERIEPAAVPQTSVSETPRRMAAVFGLLGFIAALIVAFWRSERNQVIDTDRDAAGAIDAPLLGVLSTEPARTPAAAAAVVTAPDTPQAREHQFIASKLALIGQDSQPRVVLVTSPEGTPGKSVTALNLALSAALDQRAVILADVDPTGSLSGLLDAEGKLGVADLLATSAQGDVVIGDYVASVGELPAVDDFRFIPVGTTADGGGRGVAATPYMAKLLARLLQETDLIVLDGPPLLTAPAGSRLAADADAVVVVVARGTRFEDLRRTTELLELADTPFVGFVFERSRTWRPWPAFQRFLRLSTEKHNAQ